MRPTTWTWFGTGVSTIAKSSGKKTAEVVTKKVLKEVLKSATKVGV